MCDAPPDFFHDRKFKISCDGTQAVQSGKAKDISERENQIAITAFHYMKSASQSCMLAASTEPSRNAEDSVDRMPVDRKAHTEAEACY